jgi:tRNA dimethylallyltransferase
MTLAREFGGEIVSCDSLQVFRGFDVGSAKPALAERDLVPHHLLDVADPEDVYSAADYARDARVALAEIRARGRVPVVAGGSGLYLRALFEGLFPGPSRDQAFRNRLERILGRSGGTARLGRLLARVDPESARRIKGGDRVRLIRALEVYWKTGRSLTEHQTGARGLRLTGFAPLVLGIQLPRDVLLERVRARTAAMLAGGLLQETAALLARPQGARLPPLRSIGYRQAVEVLAGKLDPLAGERAIVAETMRYAKRQMTWFRNQPPRPEWHTTQEALLARARGFLESR